MISGDRLLWRWLCCIKARAAADRGFNGPFGKIVAGLIAEGQSEPALRQQFFDRLVSPRRTATIADLQRAKNAGELRSDTEPDLLNDAIFGAIYYQLLIARGPTDQTVRRGIGRASRSRAPRAKYQELMEARYYGKRRRAKSTKLSESFIVEVPPPAFGRQPSG